MAKFTRDLGCYQFTLNYDESLEDYLRKNYPNYHAHRILSKSLDARKANAGQKPTFFYQVELATTHQDLSDLSFKFPKIFWSSELPIIVGAGPAGLFCALWLAEHGIASRIIERGDEASRRMLKIARYWRYGELDSDSNVCFGEGGAGLYSDGKLITRVKSPYIKYVMRKFVEFGAPPDTEYLSDPHLGSNKIRSIISKISDFLRSRGCQFYFNTQVVELLTLKNEVVGVKLQDGRKLESDHVILATGHSAKEIYHDLVDKKVELAAKNFAVGVRVEHPRALIDKIQHGVFCEDQILGAARYRLSYHDETTDKGTYSFCMCPGGYVLSSTTSKNSLVVNGMSNFARNSPWSNAALVVSVDAVKDAKFSPTNLLAGLNFIEDVEARAFAASKANASGRELPAQTILDFLSDKKSHTLPKNSSPSDLVSVEMKEILPPFILNHLKEALKIFQKKMPGFISEKGVLIAPETRTSSPVRIVRDLVTMESPSHKGLYPSGEGAGYAGGITSAAVDGVKVAQAIIEKIKP
ncbi:MAG: FAD-dependent oxidoreductase [Bacteriovoracaceae bacterium]|nr:FAD-dependent oxidoreductase [Bacteriovoracaceae bacterium]